MSPTRWQQIDQLLDEALECPSSDRAAFLDAACAGDTELRHEVESLLAAHGNAEAQFLAAPALDVMARAVAADRNASLCGSSLGHYQVLSVLGVGGMGEVYLARDLRLDRKVALKLLPAQFTADPARIKRFEREARAASALNHPNIITIYEVGETEGQHFIAMEYIDGETLRAVLTRERVALRTAVEWGIQLAGAIAAAHEAGIVHRDIKPENVMLRRDGYVKVLDFGLAKLTERERSLGETQGREADPAKTNPGAVLGTVKYMSPEQALGQTVDPRSDIFSCGIVLYELLTGALPFKGITMATLLDAIVHHPALPLRQVNAEAPEELERIVARALEKDRELRYQSAADLRADLKRLQSQRELSTSVAHHVAPTFARAPAHPGAAAPTSRRWLWVSALVLLLSGLAVGGWLWQRRRGPLTVAPLRAVGWSAATALQLTDQAGLKSNPSLSPDGKTIVYAAHDNAHWGIWWQRVEGGRANNLLASAAGIDHTQPAFSPDGERIAFRSERDGGGLYVMGATGENVRRVTHEGFNPSWSPDGKQIAFAAESTGLASERHLFPSALKVVELATEQVRTVTTDDAMQPAWSPNGQRIAYWGIRHAGGQRDIWTIAVSGGPAVPVTDDKALDWNPAWSPDGRYLYFASNRGGTMNLWRVALDQTTGQRLGEFEAVGAPAEYSKNPTFSRDGRRLAYVQERRRSNLVRLDFDPAKGVVTGDPRPITQGARADFAHAPSPDGQWLVWYAGEQQEDLFISRTDGTEMRRLLNDAAHDRGPRWLPDSARIVFYSDRSGNYEVWSINRDGTGLQQITWGGNSGGIVYPIPTPDGARLVYRVLTGGAFLLDFTRPWQAQQPQPLPPIDAASSLHFSPWSWSPNGQKLAGVAGPEDARPGIVVFDLTTQRYETLVAFGKRPMWLNDGRQLVFFSEGTIYLLDAITRRTRPLYSFAPQTLSRVMVAPDNRHLFLALNHVEADIWMLRQE